MQHKTIAIKLLRPFMYCFCILWLLIICNSYFIEWRMWFDFDLKNFFFVFLQPTLSNHRDQYNISWVVQSYAPILEYRLFYRKQTTSNGNANPASNNDVIHFDKFVCIICVQICNEYFDLSGNTTTSTNNEDIHAPGRM